MSRFTESDRERIQSQLIEGGRDLFAQFGFDRTRISDITEAAGIGTSTFYQFFDSKAALYAEVLSVERARLETRIGDAVAEVDSPREEVRTLLHTMFVEVRSNPLISRLIVENELRTVQERLSDAERQSITMTDADSDLTYADEWVSLPEFRYDDPRAVRGLIRSLVFVTRAEDAFIDTDRYANYEQVETLLIEVIVEGLFDDEAAETLSEPPEH